jgi:hypothetical protein
LRAKSESKIYLLNRTFDEITYISGYCDKPFENLARCMRILKLEDLRALMSKQKELEKLTEQ